MTDDMADLNRDGVIAAARVVYERLQDETLAASPLGLMDQWISSGSPPEAQKLRSLGLTTQSTDPRTHADLRLARKAFTRRYGFSIPCAEAVDVISTLSPLVEVGAGTAYWSALLRSSGVDIVPTDIIPYGRNPHGFDNAAWASVEALDATSAVRRYYNRSVFCSWPTEGENWLSEATSSMTRGNYLALIGTSRGGITGNDQLFDVLEGQFKLIKIVEIPQFPNVEDQLSIYVRL